MFVVVIMMNEMLEHRDDVHTCMYHGPLLLMSTQSNEIVLGIIRDVSRVPCIPDNYIGSR
jgi:hypothetical protein